MTEYALELAITLPDSTLVIACTAGTVLADEQLSGRQSLEKLFQDPKWVEHFMDCWLAYGSLQVEREMIFPTEEPNYEVSRGKRKEI